MLKIAISTPYFPPHIGGVEEHVKNLMENLKSRGHEVIVISSTGCGLEVPCINLPYSPIPIKFPHLKADIYHSHVPSPFFACKMDKVAKKEGKPHVVTYHNDVVVPSRISGYPVPKFVARSVERINDSIISKLLEKVELIIATTRSYAETSPVLSKFMEKVEIVPNAVNLKDFSPGIDAGEREPLVIYVGRLAAYKGVSTLIKAMAEVQKDIDAKLVIVGDGEDRKDFEILAQRLNVKVVFTGRIQKQDVVKWMQKARVLVLPSFSRLEAFGIVLIEAMACSTPVIGANIPGVSEIALNGGFTFNNISELIERIKKLLYDNKLANKLGKMGRKAVEKKFNWDVVINKIQKIYYELLS